MTYSNYKLTYKKIGFNPVQNEYCVLWMFYPLRLCNKVPIV